MPNHDSREDVARPAEDGRPTNPDDAPPGPTPLASAPVETLNEQADRLGLLDPLDVEPAHIYVPDEWAT